MYSSHSGNCQNFSWFNLPWSIIFLISESAFVFPITTVYNPNASSYTNLLQQILYNIYGIDGKNTNYTDIFYDITIGRDGVYTSNEGFDIPTGLGVFDCEKLSNYIAGL